MPCKHADKMLIYAKQAAECDEPWKLWRWRRNGNASWGTMIGHFSFHDYNDYELIPKTIDINGYKVPEPMREKPRHGSKYWYIHPDADEGVYDSTWTDHRIDDLRLSRNICHLTLENCLIHAKALFSFTEVG